MAYGGMSLTGGKSMDDVLGTDELTYSKDRKKGKPATDGALGNVISAIVGTSNPWVTGAKMGFDLIGGALSSIMESEAEKDQNSLEALNKLRASQEWIDW